MQPEHVALPRATLNRLNRVAELLGPAASDGVVLDALRESLATDLPIQGLLEQALDRIEHA